MGAGSIREWSISPDSRFAVFRADKDATARFEIYSASLQDGGDAIKLNSTLPNGGDVLDFQISPDSSHVIYHADGDTNGVVELYSVSITGGQVVKLNKTLVSGQRVEQAKISGDSQTVVYRADQDNDNIFELYRVPISGGGNERLNGNLILGGDVFFFSISPDSSRVVYVADQNEDEFREVFSVPIGGGTVKNLFASIRDSITRNAISGVYDSGDYHIGSDSDRVFFSLYVNDTPIDNIYSVPIDGGTAEALTTSLELESIDPDFIVCSDTNHLVFKGRKSTNPHSTQLYSTSITSGSSVRLSQDSFSSQGLSSVVRYKTTKNCRQVIYDTRARFGVNSLQPGLFSVPIEGGIVNHLTTVILPTGSIGQWEITNDNKRVVSSFRTNGNSLASRKFLTSSIDGSDKVLINSNDMNLEIFRFSLTEDGRWVILLGYDRLQDKNVFLYISSNGGQIKKLPGSFGRVDGYDITSDSRYLVFGTVAPNLVDFAIDTRSALFSYNLTNLLEGQELCFPAFDNKEKSSVRFALICL